MGNVCAINPRIAVVIPCYNSEKWISRTIASVLEQNCKNVIIIVVDDGSTDGSIGQIRAFGDQIILHTGPNRGACAARNTGSTLARAQVVDFVIYLDADDFLEGDILRGVSEILAKEKADIVLSNMHILHYDGTRQERFFYSGLVNPETFFEGWMFGKYFAPSSIVWSLDFVEKIGGWDESLSRSQDTDLCLRAMLFNPTILKNNIGAAIQAKVNPASLSSTNDFKATESRMRALINLTKCVPGTHLERFMPLLAEGIYSLSRTSFTLGYNDLGRRGISELSAIGHTKHFGSFKHRLLARILGLEKKVRLRGG